MVIDETDRKILRKIQDGIPVEEKPFEKVASELGMETGKVVDRVKSLSKAGVIGRFGASLNHRKLGFSSNAMIVWDVDENRADEFGKMAAGFDEVSHCYLRPKKEGKWPYNLYTMVHFDSKNECEKMAEKISEKIGVTKYELVYSTEEYKKTGVKI